MLKHNEVVCRIQSKLNKDARGRNFKALFCSHTIVHLMGMEKAQRIGVVLLGALFILNLLQGAQAWSASCSDPFFKGCYGVVHKCPAGCPKSCQVDCKFCKPICACDKPGAVCQDPRFIGGDGIMFYFHGKRGENFCLVSDTNVHINAHFIGKSRQGSNRDFTWVQALGIMFGRHQLYLGANKVAAWDDSVDQLSVAFDGTKVVLPAGQGAVVEFPSTGLKISRISISNAVSVELSDSFKVIARVVPITDEESRIHKYDITADNCFAHLEVNFKFYSLSNKVHGVLGQTYAPGFRSPVKIGVAMPIMGGEKNYATSSLFNADCAVARFEGTSSPVENQANMLPSVECSASGFGGSRGMVCRR